MVYCLTISNLIHNSHSDKNSFYIGNTENYTEYVLGSGYVEAIFEEKKMTFVINIYFFNNNFSKT